MILLLEWDSRSDREERRGLGKALGDVVVVAASPLLVLMMMEEAWW